MSLIGIIASQNYPRSVPPPVAGYTLWLDAADTSTITSSGGDVSQWNDKSGNGSNFTQTSATSKPKTGTRTLNGKNLIDFDGTNDFMTCPSSTALFNYIHTTTGATIFIVGIADDTAAEKTVMSNEGGSSLNTGIRYGITATETENVRVRNSSNIFDNISITPGSGFYLTNKLDNGNATAANRSKISLDGGSFLGSNVLTAAPKTGNATDDLHIGTISGGISLPYDGAFGEFIFYSGILSAGDITSVQNYLATKWGI